MDARTDDASPTDAHAVPDLDPHSRRVPGAPPLTRNGTLDTYSHLWPDSDDRTRQAVDSQLGGTAFGVGESLGTGEPP